MKKIGILTSGGDCGGLNAAIRSIYYRAKYKYNMSVIGIKNGTSGFLQRPVDYIELTQKTFSGYLLKQGGTFLGTTNKTSPLDFSKNGKKIDQSEQIIEGYNHLGLDGLIIIGGDGSMQILQNLARKGNLNIVAIPKTIDNDVGANDPAHVLALMRMRIRIKIIDAFILKQVCVVAERHETRAIMINDMVDILKIQEFFRRREKSFDELRFIKEKKW